MLLLAVGERAHEQCDWPGIFRMEGLRDRRATLSPQRVAMQFSCASIPRADGMMPGQGRGGKHRRVLRAILWCPRRSRCRPRVPVNNKCDEAQSVRCDSIVAQQEHPARARLMGTASLAAGGNGILPGSVAGSDVQLAASWSPETTRAAGRCGI